MKRFKRGQQTEKVPITPSLRHCSNKYKLTREGMNTEKDSFYHIITFFRFCMVYYLHYIFKMNISNHSPFRPSWFFFTELIAMQKKCFLCFKISNYDYLKCRLVLEQSKCLMFHNWSRDLLISLMWVYWLIVVNAAAPGAKLPEGLDVSAKVEDHHSRLHPFATCREHEEEEPSRL